MGTTVEEAELVDTAVEVVDRWLRRADELTSRAEELTMKRLGDLVTDEGGVFFVMQFIDRVARQDSAKIGAAQLASLVDKAQLPGFLSPVDKMLLKVGAKVAPILPSIVMPIAEWRMRSIVGHLVAPSEQAALKKHLSGQREDGYAVNVNLLGEAVLGNAEADARLEKLIELLHTPDIDYVSVKVTAVAAQLNHFAFDAGLRRISERLARLVDEAAITSPPTFVNFDMEEYADLHLTLAAFMNILGAPERAHLDAGIVLQAYLPDAFEVLQELVGWANERHRRGGGTIKIRLVKGANLAMEQVDAAMHGWEPAPFSSKIESDASFCACLDWVLTPENLTGVKIGVASHNLFHVAWVNLLAGARGVSDRVQFEMLQGMAAGQAKAVHESTSGDGRSSMLLYTPAVSDDDFDVAIGYLFRRLEENAAEQNFMRKLFDLAPGSAAFKAEADFFRRGLEARSEIDTSPRRQQDRRNEAKLSKAHEPFFNEPDTDPTLPQNIEWITEVSQAEPRPLSAPLLTATDDVQRVVDRAQAAALVWGKTPAADRRRLLHQAGAEIASRRGELITTMMHEASKTFAQADNEVSEAVDFARWYADHAVELEAVDGAEFTPHGTVAVIPPWNFPCAIPAGGMLSALAAGNTVICKPAPETPRCAEIIAEAIWAAGVPGDVLQFVRTPDNEVGQTLVESVDAVILTGSSETAGLFREWKPELRLFAETSGKNALIVTPNADLDMAVADLVQSAFGHSGQKCSAASIAILVGDVYTSKRFRRQLIDAVTSLSPGSPLDLETDVAPLVGGINSRLQRGIEQLEPGESWLVAPAISEDGVLLPSVRDGVKPGSWFHRTECFGPMLGLVNAATLEEALEIANTSDFGLTGGIHTLDSDEIKQWLDAVEIGNCYVNRPITGAIVQRQPFGGWKRSSVGPGAKAGGPNYLMQLGTWSSTATADTDDYAEQWQRTFSQHHDDAGLFCEANVLRYRPLPVVGAYVAPDAHPNEVRLLEKACKITGVELVWVNADGDDFVWLTDMAKRGIERVRLVGVERSGALAKAAQACNIELLDGPVTPAGRVELLSYLKEQSISTTLHRFGNLVAADDILAALNRDFGQ